MIVEDGAAGNSCGKIPRKSIDGIYKTILTDERKDTSESVPTVGQFFYSSTAGGNKIG